MSLFNAPCGPLPKHDYNLSNEEFNIILKLKFGKILIPRTVQMRCKYCNIILDPYGIHATLCKHGFGPVALHDGITKWLEELLGLWFSGTEYIEREPNIDGTNERPDIIFHNKVRFRNELVRLIWDLICPNIWAKKHLELIESGSVRVFGCGKEGIKRKNRIYASENRCADLRRKGYIFTGVAVETMGGVDLSIKRLICNGIDRHWKNKTTGELALR
eukprot:237651_1